MTKRMNPQVHRSPGRTGRPDERGFSLLEAVIAMTILSIGLLGLAAMQTMALSRNVDAKELGIAGNLAAEMVERIHFNRVNVADYSQGAITVDGVGLGNGIDTADGGITRPPASQPTARGDYDQWQANLNGSGLNDARGIVLVTSPFGPVALNQSQVVVQVRWTTKGQGQGNQERAAIVTLQSVVSPP